MCDQIQDIKDELAVMLRQEGMHYMCPDYMAHERGWYSDKKDDDDDDEIEQLQQSMSIKVCNIDPELRESICSVSAFDCHDNNCYSNGVVKSVSTPDVMDLQHSHPDVVDGCRHRRQSDTVKSTTTASTAVVAADASEQTFRFWRQQMFDWACMVVDTFNIDRNAVAMSFNILDRFVAIEIETPNSPPVTRDDYQLFSMVSLYIVVKLIESYPQKLTTQALVDMSRNFYSKEVIEITEIEICTALNWRLHAPTAIGYCRLFINLLPSYAIDAMSKQMIITATTLTEIAVSDSYFVSYKPSLVGLAALIHAALMDGIPKDAIMVLCNHLEGLITVENNEEFRSVYTQLEKLYCQ
jgi:hypothetical protein